MPTKALKKNLMKKSRHVVAWVRETLGLKQSELASLIGISPNTLQSIELGRLPLSERIAYRLSEQTGIRAKWLLDNELGDPPPDPAEMRRKYEKAQAQPWRTSIQCIWCRGCSFSGSTYLDVKLRTSLGIALAAPADSMTRS